MANVIEMGWTTGRTPDMGGWRDQVAVVVDEEAKYWDFV